MSEKCKYHPWGHEAGCPICNNILITALRSRVEELEQQLALSKPMYSRRQLEDKIADLERENAELKPPTYCPDTVWQNAQRAAYERCVEIANNLHNIRDNGFDTAKIILSAIRAEMEKGGVE